MSGGAAMLALFMLGSAPSSGQPLIPIVHVGDPAMNGSAIQPYDNVWLVTVHYNDGRIVDRGLSTDHVRFIDVNGKRYLSRIEGEDDVIVHPGQQPVGRSSMTFNIFDPATMAPLHGESHSSAGDAIVRDFDGTRVTTKTRTTAGGPDASSETSTKEAVFDFHGGMTGLLLASLPLAPGFQAQLPGIGDSDLDYTPIRVIGEETVAAGRLGIAKAWKVEIGPAPAKSIYWISKQAPYVLKAVVNGPHAFASWDMIR